MPEPTSTAAGVLTVATGTAATAVLTAFGVPLGLRVDLLIAGFAGALVAIVLLNTVPGTGDTWRELLGHAAGATVYVQDGAVIGDAPDLPVVLIDI